MSSFIRRAGATILKLIEQAGNPGGLTDRIFLYGKDAAGITQLYAQASDGTVYQLTPFSASVLGTLWGINTDGDLNFDGTTTVLGAVPVAGVYTMGANIFATSIIIAAGVEVRPNTHVIHCRGAIALSGVGTAKITTNGNPGADFTGGAAIGVSITPGATAGGNGGANSGNGSAGGASGAAALGMTAGATAAPGVNTAGTNSTGTCLGGSGGGGPATNGGASGTVTIDAVSPVAWLPRNLFDGRGFTAVTPFTGATGGGGGGGGAAGRGGGGGSGGAWTVVTALSIDSGITLEAKGGDGATPTTGTNGGGGAGGGGGIVVAQVMRGSVTVDVSGGTGAAGNGTGKKGGDGHAGLNLSWGILA